VIQVADDRPPAPTSARPLPPLVRVLAALVAVAALAVAGISLYFAVGALLAAEREAIPAIVTTVVCVAIAAVILRALRRRGRA
jgi:hypothetical protein